MGKSVNENLSFLFLAHYIQWIYIIIFLKYSSRLVR